ncbi:MAG: pilus assembly protein [Planctomycetaceae bacterium]|nr:pilus assembly protein [Planctomycetaceae bacterium]
MVETALVLPIMMMVILGIVEFGRAFMVCQLLTNASREGGRAAVIPGSTSPQVTADVQTLVANTVGVDTTEVTVGITVTPYAGGNPHSDLSLAQKRDLCDIRVVVAYDAVSFVPTRWLTGVNLTGQTAMRHE